jgi:hypothetical protein
MKGKIIQYVYENGYEAVLTDEGEVWYRYSMSIGWTKKQFPIIEVKQNLRGGGGAGGSNVGGGGTGRCGY